MKLITQRKGAMPLSALLTAGITMAVLVIVLVVAQLIVADLSLETTAGTHARNTTTEGAAGLFELADWLPLIGLVIAASVIVGIVMYYMGGVARRA